MRGLYHRGPEYTAVHRDMSSRNILIIQLIDYKYIYECYLQKLCYLKGLDFIKI
jgi:hypothetical protein